MVDAALNTDVKTGLFDNLWHWEDQAAKLTPGALLRDLRAAEVKLVSLEQGILGLLKANDLLVKLVLPAIQAELALEGIVIPPAALALIEHLVAMQTTHAALFPPPVPAPPESK